MVRAVRVIDLDILPYRDAWQRQEAVHADVVDGGEEAILLVEHPPTITLGRRAEVARSHIVASTAELRRLGVEVVETDRGGDVTYHGPGQVVAYPVVRLADRGLSVGGYMRRLQEAVVATVADFEVQAFRDAAAPGVWANDPPDSQEAAKLAAVGVRVRGGATLHGLALNVEPNLSHFNLINACGLGRATTSLHKLRGGKAPSILAVKAVLAKHLKAALATPGGSTDKA